MSIRRAFAVLGGGRSSYHYAARRPPQAVLSRRVREIAATRVRYGYRRIHVLLRREGWQVNVKRIYRLYTEEGLQLRHKTPKRRVVAKLREGRSPPTGAERGVGDGLPVGPSCSTDAGSGSSPSSTPSAGSRRRSTSGPVTAARTWSRRWSGSPRCTARRRRFASTLGPSSSARHSICGPSSTA